MLEENQEQDDEISLIDLFAVIWRKRIMITAITFIAAAGVVLYSIISIKLPPEESFLPNQYTPKALMLINNSSSSGSSLSSMVSNMGGLSSLAGVNMPVSSNNSEFAMYLIKTNSFLDAIAENFNLAERYKIEKNIKTKTRKMLKNSLKTEYTARSGVLEIKFTNKDPVYARDVVNFCTAYLEKRFNELGLDKNKIEKENLETNLSIALAEIDTLEEETRRLEQSVASVSYPGGYPAISRNINRIALELTAERQLYTQLKVQYELLKVNMASERPVFQLLEAAELPEMKSGPARSKLCVIVTLAGFFFAIILTFVLDVVSKIRKDPKTMAKLKGKS